MDGHAAIDYALSRPDVQGRPLYLYGQSIGGSIGIVVAAERAEVQAVVVESPFSGYRRIAARHVQQLVFSKSLAKGIVMLTVSPVTNRLISLARLLRNH